MQKNQKIKAAWAFAEGKRAKALLSQLVRWPERPFKPGASIISAAGIHRVLLPKAKHLLSSGAAHGILDRKVREPLLLTIVGKDFSTASLNVL